MRAFLPSSSNDLQIGADGLLKVCAGKDAYAAILNEAVRTLRGEMQLDTGRGVPYFDTVFKNYGGIEQWKNAVRNIINSYPFVTIIDSFDAEIVGKAIHYRIVISTDEGEVAVTDS